MGAKTQKNFKFRDIWLATFHMAFFETVSQTFTCRLTVSNFPRFLHLSFSCVLLYHSVSRIFHFSDYDLFHLIFLLLRSLDDHAISHIIRGSRTYAFIDPWLILTAYFLHFLLVCYIL